MPNHLISTDVNDFPEETKPYHDIMSGRSMLVKKTELIPIECVVRGYIIGSGWKDYQKTGAVCGHSLPEGLQLAQQLSEPLFTPAAKAFEGHDENISVAQMKDQVGSELTQKLETLSMDIYNQAAEYANERDIIIADTKFEFGLLDGEVIIIDEVLTPDSSRFWAKDTYEIGKSPKVLISRLLEIISKQLIGIENQVFQRYQMKLLRKQQLSITKYSNY